MVTPCNKNAYPVVHDIKNILLGHTLFTITLGIGTRGGRGGLFFAETDII